MEKPKGSLISFFANKVKTYGGVNLAQGIPAFAPPEGLLNILSVTVQEPVHQYAPGVGNSVLLDWLSEKYNKPKHNFLVVNGATEAISLLFIYLKEKLGAPFSVLGFSPVYETYKNLPKIFNVPFLPFLLDKNGGIDFEKLEQYISENQVKLVMFSSPGNPYGKVWTKTETDKLVEICSKLEVYVIIDAVYADLYFDNKPYYPIENLSEYVFYVNSFSKKFSITGWRIGYLLAHDKHIQEVAEIHDYTGLCAPSVLQQALATYLQKTDGGNNYIINLRKQLETNYKRIADAFAKLNFEVVPAQGGYFVWAKLPSDFESGLSFALELYEKEKVAVVPGEHFSDTAKEYIRINIARFPNEIETAIDRVRAFIETA